jgi:5'-phosphate synthase pdxT subunit
MEALARAGAAPRRVTNPADLENLSALCMPGGESTTMSLLLDASGLRQPLAAAIADGLPLLATCAGVILLARGLTGDSGSIKVAPLGLLDAVVDRNYYGRQVDSFEATLTLDMAALGLADGPAEFPGIFIRAPRFQELGPRAVPVATHEGTPVAVRQGNIIAAMFHPELSGDDRFHQALMSL